jgi:hypothetical protein
MKMIKTISEDRIVAYAAPLIPILNVKIKIGSNIIFKMLDDTVRIVGNLELPSACRVSENILTKMNMYAKTTIVSR